MLKSLLPRLVCPECQSTKSLLRSHAFTESDDGHIQDGVLACESCQSWYPIEDSLLELVKVSLQDREGFRSRFREQLARVLTTSPISSDSKPAAQFTEQLKQREVFDWYAENEKLNYSDYQNTPFWVAEDALTFAKWKPHIQRESWLLDVGCADGRSTFQLVLEENTVIGFDISKKMIKKAIQRAKSLGIHHRMSFFVSDGNCLPFQDESFDFVMTYGVLHHLPNPEGSCRDFQRILKKGGIHFASENNKSIFRGLFDLIMTLVPLWKEEAGAEPVISESMFYQWTEKLPVHIKVATSVFLPPHLINLVGRKAAYTLLNLSDRMLGSIPFIRKQGGLIVCEIRKLET